MAELLEATDVFERLCKSTGKWGMYVSLHSSEEDGVPPKEYVKAAPYLQDLIHKSVFEGDQFWLLFDTEEEMRGHYDQTVGDDGPTKANPYDGPATIYALTCSPDGQLLNENT